MRQEPCLKEENHLMKRFIGNGYPQAFVRSAAVPRPLWEPSINSDDSDDVETSKKKPLVAFLSYVAGVSERIRKVCQTSTLELCLGLGPLYATAH